MKARAANLTDEAAVQRILALYDAADGETRAAGRTWYGRARDYATVVARLARVDVERGAAASAPASPRAAWRANVTAAVVIATAVGLGMPAPKRIDGLPIFGRNLRAAEDALLGRPYPAGPKVRAFKCNILTGGQPCAHDCVTVDTIAARIALGIRNGAVSLTDARYRALADAYREAARRREVPPAVMQATTWIAYRGGAARAMREDAAIERMFDEMGAMPKVA